MVGMSNTEGDTMANATKKTTAEAATEEPIEAPAIDAIEQIQTAAKEVFDLRKKLQGFGRPKRVPVFLDIEALERRNEVFKQYTQAKQQVEFFEGMTEVAGIDATSIARARQLMEQYEEELKPLTEKMLEGALSIHMHGIPRIAIKRHRQKARSAIVGERGGKVPPDRQEDFEDETNRRVLQEMLDDVVDAEGNHYTPDASALQELLPDGQWDKLQGAMNRLVFEDAVGDAATDDPGF